MNDYQKLNEIAGKLEDAVLRITDQSGDDWLKRVIDLRSIANRLKRLDDTLAIASHPCSGVLIPPDDSEDTIIWIIGMDDLPVILLKKLLALHIESFQRVLASIPDDAPPHNGIKFPISVESLVTA